MPYFVRSETNVVGETADSHKMPYFVRSKTNVVGEICTEGRAGILEVRKCSSQDL